VGLASAARRDEPRRASAKPAFLKALPEKLERPMLLLSFAWFLVVVAELVCGVNGFLLVLGTALWALLIAHFCFRLAVAADKKAILKRNWLFMLAILVPVLRFFPLLQSLPWVRAVTATFGLQVIWIFASADHGLRSLSRTMGRRGAGYALTSTAVVILAGAAGMLHFESGSLDPQGIHSYPKAIWWVAMQVTTIGSGYRPETRGGLALCLGISVFATAMFGYLTALFAAFFIGKAVEDPKSAIPNQTSIHQLSGEVALLRKTIEGVLLAGRDRPAEPPK
jgi:voltage-gated potassium channel